uniref:Chromo domain-containing protein n=1 Tax=Panagrolaimus sp. ES5 TaxID=591445 RepID=A0AC34F410_9BILA
MSSTNSDESAEFEVEKILDKKGSGRSLQYLVKWKGYDETTWEPATNCGCKELIIAFERDHAKSPKSAGSASLKRGRPTARVSVDETPESSVTPETSTTRKRSKRVQKSPKRRLPASESPTLPPLVTDDSDESEYFIDPTMIQGSSRTSPRKPVKKTADTPGTPKKAPNTPGRTRASLRTSAAVSPKSKRSKVAERSASSSSRSPHLQTTPSKRTRSTAGNKTPKSPKKKSPAKTQRTLTPLSEADDLDFEIERIDSLADANGHKKLLVKTVEGRSRIVDIKAAAKQNCDLVLDFLIALNQQKNAPVYRLIRDIIDEKD